MPTKYRSLRAISLAIMALALGPGSAQAQADSLPPDVTPALVRAGAEIYAGQGHCARCHGERGQGTEEGPPLTAGQWKLGSGDYDWLIHITRHSGIAAWGRDGDPVPMRGPTLLSDEEVRAVAAYVWTISRDRRPGPAKR
jgi:mono/diheme cytochrome c family protein